MLHAYSVFPSLERSDVVVQPYNSVLAIQHLIDDCDINTVLDNSALYSVLERQMKLKHPSFSELNTLIQRNMLDTTASLRFGGPQNAGLRKMATNICPFPRMHFLTTTVAPLRNSRDAAYDALDIKQCVSEMFNSNNSYCMTDISRGKILAGAGLFRGNFT